MTTPEISRQEQKGNRPNEPTPHQYAVSREISQILQPIEAYVQAWAAIRYPPPIQKRTVSERVINLVTGQTDIMKVRLREIEGRTLCKSISVFDNSVQFDVQGHITKIVARGGAIHVNIQDPRKMQIIERTALFPKRFRLDKKGLTRLASSPPFARAVGFYARDALSEFLPEALR